MLNPKTEVGARNATFTQVADSATSVTLKAANPARVGAIITNTSSAVLLVRCDGNAATTAAYTARLAASGGSFEVPFQYHGIITGIWASDPGDGNANVTEFTA
jgi:hypothetical protein